MTHNTFRYLVPVLLALFSFSANAQLLFESGKIPDSEQYESALLILEDHECVRVLPIMQGILHNLGFEVVVDGERSRSYSGLVTTVTIRDTSYTRNGTDLAVRRIHRQKPTDIVVEVGGNFTNLGVRRLTVAVIESRTGVLNYSLSSPTATLIKYEDLENHLVGAFLRSTKEG